LKAREQEAARERAHAAALEAARNQVVALEAEVSRQEAARERAQAAALEAARNQVALEAEVSRLRQALQTHAPALSS